jgi:lipopolysaccharide heptosyltransferase II
MDKRSDDIELNTDSPRILVVGVDWMGDVIFSTPLLRALKSKYPKSFIAYSTTARCGEVLKNNSNVDEVVAFNEKPFLWGIMDFIAFVKQIRQRRFDAAIFIHRSATRAFLCFCAGIPIRTGYAGIKRGWLVTHPARPEESACHRIDRYFNSARKLNLSTAGREVELFISNQDNEDLEKIIYNTDLRDGRKYAVIHPGANWKLKRWPVEYFADIVSYLEKKGICSVLCGTESEKPIQDAIAERARSKNTVLLCGQTSVGSLAALMSRSMFVISADSGPLHIGAGLGTPLIALFGPTSPVETGPVSKGIVKVVMNKVNCDIPCYARTCEDKKCMEELRPHQVVHAIEEVLIELTNGRKTN